MRGAVLIFYIDYPTVFIPIYEVCTTMSILEKKIKFFKAKQLAQDHPQPVTE